MDRPRPGADRARADPDADRARERPGPFQTGVIFTVALGVGLFTPPVGTNIFVVCNVARVDMWAVSKELVPFWIASAAVLALLALVPALSEWLPRLVLG